MDSWGCKANRIVWSKIAQSFEPLMGWLMFRRLVGYFRSTDFIIGARV
jgi:hypothetical protein